jgi:hypothetical protein
VLREDVAAFALEEFKHQLRAAWRKHDHIWRSCETSGRS